MKYLKLNFEGAKQFLTNKGTKDFVFDVVSGEKHKRKNLSMFSEMITFYQITNMLHVLFMERPKPSLKTCLYERSEKYDKMASNSFLFIKTPTELSKKGSTMYPKEKIDLKKAVYDSWDSGAQELPMTWDQVRKFFFYKEEKGKVSFDEFVEFLEDEGFDVNGQFEKLADDIRSSDEATNDKVFEWLTGDRRQCKVLANYLHRNGDVSKNPLIQEKTSLNKLDSSVTVLGGPGDVVKLSGTILIPVDDDDIEKLRRGKGTATILDGGVVMIEGVYYEDDIEWDNYMPYLKQVKELSVEQTK